MKKEGSVLLLLSALVGCVLRLCTRGKYSSDSKVAAISANLSSISINRVVEVAFRVSSLCNRSAIRDSICVFYIIYI